MVINNSAIAKHESMIPQVAVKKKPSGFFKGFSFALAGIVHTVQTQRNMKVHVLCALMVTLFAIIFAVSITIQLLMLLCIGLVFFAEVLNTALEALVDFYSPKIHPVAKIAKDAAAGAVLILSVVAAIIFLAVALPLFANLSWALEKVRIFALPSITIVLSEFCLLFYRAKKTHAVTLLCIMSSAVSFWPFVQSSTMIAPILFALSLVALASWVSFKSTFLSR